MRCLCGTFPARVELRSADASQGSCRQRSSVRASQFHRGSPASTNRHAEPSHVRSFQMDAKRKRRRNVQRQASSPTDSIPRFSATASGSVPRALDLYLQETRADEFLSDDRERQLARTIQLGSDEALDELVRANRRFVVSIAKKYQHRGVELEDLIQEGNIGLITAARRFDPDRGPRFLSYAFWWIRKEILVAVYQQNHTVRIPRDLQRHAAHVSRARARLRQTLLREPTIQEIAESLGIGPEEVELADAIGGQEVRLDEYLPWTDKRETRRPLDAITADDAASDPASELDRQQQRDEVERALRGLPERFARVLRLYYGLDQDEDRSLEEIGTLLGVTRQRVHNLQKRALNQAREAMQPAPVLRYRSRRRQPGGSSLAGLSPAPGAGSEVPGLAHGEPGDLTAAQWAAVCPLLIHPRRTDRRGRRPTDPREALDGIFWMLRRSARWQDIPDRYPPARTCREHFRRWVSTGVFERVLCALAADLNTRGGLTLADCFFRRIEGAPSWQGQTAQLLLSAATLQFLQRAGSPLLSDYPPAVLTRRQARRPAAKQS